MARRIGGEEQGKGGISRRTLLIGGGAGIGLVVAWAAWPRRYQPNLATAEGESLLNAFLKIGRDGRVIVAIPQLELGQGVYTALPQILADELGADWRTVAVEPAPISPLYANRLLAEQAVGQNGLASSLGIGSWSARNYAVDQALMVTGGSTSVRGFEARLREAGAGARALLSQAAAETWGVDWLELDTHDGFVWRGADRLAFADLAERAAELELPETLPVRGGLDHRLVGQGLPRLDLPSKIDGSALFAGDIRLPNMVHVALRSAPAGSRLVSIDKEAADRIHGALRVVQRDDFVAVAAANFYAAAKALDALRPRYELDQGLPSDGDLRAALLGALDEGDGERLVEIGTPDEKVAGTSLVTARYSVAALPSAAIEPLTATARLIGDRLEVWAPVQAPGLAREAAAKAVGFAPAQVAIYPTFAGGGYGRKLETDAVAQAAFLAMTLDRPVQLTWPRIQEIQRDTPAPPSAARLTAAVGPRGIASWLARIAVPATAARAAERLGIAADYFEPDGGPVGGAVPPYDIAGIAVDHVEVTLGIPTGIGRGGSHVATNFFTESFVDELAVAAGLEPMSFRMRMLANNPRMARALSTATSIGGWDGGARGSGMGIAAFSGFGSYAATLVEIEVTGEQKVRVLRAVCAVDCGRIVNPDLVRQQIEGGLIHGIAAAVGNGVEMKKGIPTARTIADHGLPILANAPEVTVELLDSEEAPGGVTELAVPTAAPAVANALYSLTGRRVRRLPLVIGS